MGLLEDYNVDLDDFEANSFEVPDGVYDYAIGEVAVQDGSKNNPEQPMLYIHYILTNEEGKNYTNREYFWIPADPGSPTDKEKAAMGRLKTRIMSLGFEEDEVNDVSPEELVGLTGTYQLVTSRGFQNVRNVRPDEDGDEPEPEPTPTPKRRAAKPVDKPVSKPKAEPEAEPKVELPEDQPEPSDAAIKAKIEARRAARRAAAGK